jgi:predicted small lipoprotein YifL
MRRIVTRPATILFALVFAAILAGCGQKGPLKLPPPPQTNAVKASLA